jgi:hypothetical protein
MSLYEAVLGQTAVEGDKSHSHGAHPGSITARRASPL